MQLLTATLLAVLACVWPARVMGDSGQSGTVPSVPGSDPFRYPGGVEQSMGKRLRLNGVPVSSTYFVTRDDMEHVADFYKRAAGRLGLLFAESGSPGRRTIVAVALDGSVKFSVNMYSTEQGVLVFPSRMALHELAADGQAQRTRASPSTDLPVMPGADGVVTVDSDDGLLLTQVVNYQVKAKILECIEFFKGQMRMKGFRLDSRATRIVGSSAVMSFKRPARACTVTVTWNQATRRSSIHVVYQRSMGP